MGVLSIKDGSDNLFRVLTTTSAVLFPIFSKAERPCLRIEARNPVVRATGLILEFGKLVSLELALETEVKESKNGIVDDTEWKWKRKEWQNWN